MPQGQTSEVGASGVGRTPVNVDSRSPLIVPIIMFGTFILGIGIILANYIPHGQFGMPSNWYLLGGLGLILVGIVAATQYR